MKPIDDVYSALIDLIERTKWDLRYIASNGTSNLAADQTRIYLVDTQTGWFAHGAVSISNFKKAASAFLTSGITHTDVLKVTNALTFSFKGEQVTNEGAQLLLAMVALWFSGTETFGQVFENEAPGTHIFAFSYTTQNGDLFLRPATYVDDSLNFFPIEELAVITREMVSKDTNSKQSLVGNALSRAGGPLLNPVFI